MDEVIAAVVLSAFVGAVPLTLLALFVLDTRAELGRLRKRIADLEQRKPAPAPILAPKLGDEPTVELPRAELPVELRPRDLSPDAPTQELPPPKPPAPPPKAPPKPRKPAPPPFQLPSPERLVVWFAAAAGGLVALLAVLFALVAVVEAGWVGPALRVAAGFAGGTALWVAGAAASRFGWRWTGSAVAGAGIGALYGASYAGSGLYHLFPAEVAGPLMVAITGVGTLRAWRHDDRWVALLSLFGGLLTPVLLSTGENRPYHLFAYLVLLLAGMLAASSKRGWFEVVGVAGLGTGILYAGWSAQWYVADQTPAGLVGAVVLAIPFLLTATSASVPVRAMAQLVVVGLVLTAIPWLLPVDSTFYDPRSNLAVVRGPVIGALPVALTALFLGVAPFLVGRRNGTTWDTVHALPGALLLPIVATSSFAWSDAGDPALLLGAGGIAVCAGLATLGSPASGWIALPLPAITGVALAIAGESAGPVAALGGPLLVAVSSRLVQLSTRSGVPALSGLVGVAIVSFVGRLLFEGAPLRTAAAASLLVFATEGLLAVRGRRPSLPEAAWVAAAAMGIAVFPTLYAAWGQELGTDVIGLLPVLLGAGTLSATLSLGRRERLPSDHWLVSVFVLVVALGVTVALPLQLHTRWLTVGLALEAALLAWIAQRVRLHDLVRVVAVGLSFAVAARLLLNPFALQWGSAAEGWPILNWTLYSWGVPMLALLGVARWSAPRSRTDLVGLAQIPVLLLAILVGFGLVNVEIAHAFRDSGPLQLDLFGGNRLESMVRSACWAGYGLAILGAGLWADQRFVRLVGFSFVLLATGKVFVVDLWDLAGFVRVGSLFCLAISLLLAAFAFERLVLRSTATPAPPRPDPETP